MAVKMNLWSLTLLPGEPVSMLVPRDFVLTQAALGEDLKSADGRSVIKVTHQPIPPHWFDSDDEDSDEELDSELEEELEDEFEVSEEDDEEEEKPKAKVNGKKADEAAEEDEEDDEDEDDEDEDSDFSDDDELAETNVICSLLAGRVEQASVNLTFTEGEAVMFEVTGENAVHLMGNYINQMPSYADSDSEDDSDFDSEDYDDYSELYGDEEDSEDDAAATIEELDEKPAPAAPKKEKKAVAAAPAAAPKAEKPAKAESKPTPAAAPKRKAEEIAADTSMTSTDGLSKNQKKKLAKKAKLEADGGKPAPAAEKSSKRTLPSGLVIEDVKLGEGPGAKTGKKLGMRYIGKLENGKQFDANTAGAPFKFVLGRGEVIRGWDEGLVGMAVGGERRLTLAYGNQKIPGIPKGSTLKFDVKLVSIN